MIISYPTQDEAFDRIPESVVQQALFSISHPLGIRREVNYGGCRADFVTSKHIIEVKKSTGGSQPHALLGQILFYRSCHRINTGKDLEPIILVYGSSLNSFASDYFTLVRREFGIAMKQLVSLRRGIILDVDSMIYEEWANYSHIGNQRAIRADLDNGQTHDYGN